MSESSHQEPRKGVGCLRWGAIGLVIVAAAGVWFYSAVQDARESAQYCWCNNQFKQVGLAMLNYKQARGCFPPAYLADRDGQPMHSWRVLQLPFMAQEERYQQYKFDEPWNSPHNSTLADWPVDTEDRSPSTYVCPSDWNAQRCDTSKFVFVGPHTAFPGSCSTSIRDFTDGASNTALGSERSESGVHWMKPWDLNVEEMSFRINDKSRIGLRSNHPQTVNVSIADGSVRSIADSIDPEVLKALITIDGGEEDAGKFMNH